MFRSDWSKAVLTFLHDWLIRMVKFLGGNETRANMLISDIADSGKFSQVASRHDLVSAALVWKNCRQGCVLCIQEGLALGKKVCCSTQNS